MPDTRRQRPLVSGVRGNRTLSAPRHPNFRLFFAAQSISNIGTRAQITVENWLVLQLSHSGLALGVTNALQFGPMVLPGLYGGVVADRHDRRRILMLTQTCPGLQAFAMGLLACTVGLRVWMIWLAEGIGVSGASRVATTVCTVAALGAGVAGWLARRAG
jgi:MFS family permease